MHLNPYLYQKIIRPKFAIKKYIEKTVKKEFNFDNSKVLDFGCGTGSNSFIFDNKNYIGVDTDRKRIEFAKKIFPNYKFEVIGNNEGKLDVKTNSMDYIFISATIHHISDAIFHKYVKDFKRILKKDGRIIAIEPVLHRKHKFKNIFMDYFDDGKYIRTEEEYKKLFENLFTITIHKKFSKFIFYNEIFFSATKK